MENARKRPIEADDDLMGGSNKRKKKKKTLSSEGQWHDQAQEDEVMEIQRQRVCESETIK